MDTSVEYQKTRVSCPADVEPVLAERIRRVALQAFEAVGARGYVRVDIRLDETDQPCVLEVNCNPCLDEGMALARSAERAGIPFPQLLQKLLKFALEPLPNDPQVPMLPRRAAAGNGVAAHREPQPAAAE